MKLHNVLSPFKDADGIHKPGDEPVLLSDKDAAELIGIGAVEPVATTSPTQPVVPTDPGERQTAIVDAIGKLNVDNADLWLRDGKPDSAAIAVLTGWPVSAAERNAAWASMQSAP